MNGRSGGKFNFAACHAITNPRPSEHYTRLLRRDASEAYCKNVRAESMSRCLLDRGDVEHPVTSARVWAVLVARHIYEDGLRFHLVGEDLDRRFPGVALVLILAHVLATASARARSWLR